MHKLSVFLHPLQAYVCHISSLPIMELGWSSSNTHQLFSPDSWLWNLYWSPIQVDIQNLQWDRNDSRCSWNKTFTGITIYTNTVYTNTTNYSLPNSNHWWKRIWQIAEKHWRNTGSMQNSTLLTNNIPARETALSAWLRKSHRNPGFRSDYIKIRLQHESSWPPVSKALIPSIKAIATITPYSRTELRQFSVVRKNDVNCVDFTLPVIFHTVEVAINGLWWLVGKGWTNDMRLFLMQKLLFLDHAWTTEH